MGLPVDSYDSVLQNQNSISIKRFLKAPEFFEVFCHGSIFSTKIDHSGVKVQCVPGEI
jgi:hypothetical protein